MTKWLLRGALAAAAVLAMSGVARAQVTVTLTNTSQTTQMTANVSEQARVIVPASVTFNVTDIGSATPASAASVTIDRIVLATATKQFQVALQANAASFTPPVGGATTWDAADVSWNAASWTQATGASGTLSSSAYNTVATCNANVADCSTSALVFTLAPKTSVMRSGNHAITVTWRFASIGS